MANDLRVSVRIGAALLGSFRTAFDSARGTSLRLGQTADDLRARHTRLGDVMARAMSHPTRNVGELRRQYERLGQTIDQLRIKQEKLATSMARGEALKSQRADMRGQAMETAGTALAMGAPVVQAVRLAAGYQDQVKDIAITGEFSPAEEARLGSALRESALKWNQTQADVARGAGVLVAGGIQDAKALEKYAPIMAKAATATRSSMDDLGSVAIALKDNLRVGEEGFEGALNMLAYAGKRGQFELRDMAKWLPKLSPSFEALGVSGKEAVAEIGASLQIARKGAGSNDEAGNNFKNFIEKLTAPDTLNDFEKAGVDLKQSMMNMRAEGLTPLQSMLNIITKYLTTKSPEAAGQFQNVMKIEDNRERMAALQRLTEAYKLGELFQDMQAMSFIRPAIANRSEMKDISQGAMAASDKGLLDTDYQKRMRGASEKFKEFKIGLADIGITIGDALLPPLTELMQAVRPGIQAFGAWAKEHPGVIKGVLGLVGGLLAGKLAFIGLRYGINLVMSPFNALGTSINTVSGKWMALRARMQAGEFPRLVAGITRARSALSAFGARASTLGFSGVGRGLMTGLQAALPWIGRAGMMLLRLTPIGLALSAVGLVVYKYWQPIKGFFSGLWQGLSSVAGPAIKSLIQSLSQFGSSLGRLALSIPGVGFAFHLLRSVAGPVLGAIGSGVRAIWGWFKALLQPVEDVGGRAQSMGHRFGAAIGGIIKAVVDLPARFLKLGGDIVNGLANGIQGQVGTAISAVGGLGDSVANKFKSVLGIHSPSRVFQGFGDNIAQGAALGIGRSAALAGKAAGGMARATAAAWGDLRLPGPTVAPIGRNAAPLAARQEQSRAGAPAGGGGAETAPSPGGWMQALRPGISAVLDASKEDSDLNQVMSTINELNSSVDAAKERWTQLRAIGHRALEPHGSQLRRMGQSALSLGKALGGNLVAGLRAAGQAVLWVGRAMMMNPIGLAVTGIAAAGYLIYRHWAPIKGFFRSLWSDVKASFAGVAKWFGADLPKSFTDFGGMLIGGLVRGVTAKLGAARDTIVNFGSSIKGWFTSTLGIKSPSRVFMGFGDNIAQGAALGVARSSALAGKAVAGMALATTSAWGQPLLAEPSVGGAKPPVELRRAELARRVGEARAAAPAVAPTGADAGMVIHFAPQITVQRGDAAAAQRQVGEAMQLSFAEFERMMKRYDADRRRRAYGGN